MFRTSLLLILIIFNSCQIQTETEPLSQNKNSYELTSCEKITAPKIEKDTTIYLSYKGYKYETVIKSIDDSISYKGTILALHGWNLPHLDWCDKTSLCEKAKELGLNCHAGHGLTFDNVSSIASIGAKDNNGIINEEQNWNPKTNHTDYAISKHKSELEVWRGTQEGVPAVIVNPGFIIGSHFWNRSSSSIFNRVNSGLKFYPTGKISLVSVEDVVKASINLMNSEIKNETPI